MAKGIRNPEDEALFKQPTDDPTIQPDTVTPAVEGYFRIPAVWIGEKPDDASVLELNPQVHHAVVVKQDLHSGLKVSVQRDGTFLFDFSSRLSQEKLTVTGSPHVCVQGSGPSRGGGGRLAAHTRLALRSLASRASRRLRTPRRSLARVIPFTPYRRHSQSTAQPSRNQRPRMRRPMRPCSLPNGTTARNPSPPQGNVVRGLDEDWEGNEKSES